WSVFVRGQDVERAAPGDEALLWLGPDKNVAAAPSGHRVWKTNDPALERDVRASLTHAARKVTIDMALTGALGEHPVLEGALPTGATARVTLDAKVEPARSAPLDAEALRDKLGRLGDTPFELGSLRLDLPPNVLLPLSSLNRARRALATALLAATPAAHATTATTAADVLAAAHALIRDGSPRLTERDGSPRLAERDGSPRPAERPPPPPGLFVLCRSLAHAEAALDAGADGVYLDLLELTGTGAAVRALRARPQRAQLALAPPRIRKPGEEKIDRYLASLEPDAILVRGLGALHEASPGGPLRIGDFSLNVANTITAAEVLAHGLAAFTPSFDLDAAQLTALLSPALAPFAEVVVHHPMPLFHMEHCVIAALLSDGRDHKTCGRPCERHQVSLRDRAGLDHPVEADVGCRNTVFHAAPQSAAHVVKGLQDRGVRRFRIELVRESAADVARVVGTYKRLLAGEAAPAEVWRALKTEGGYGVVKGSLRVVA
ncbi:MAG TPA: DUF3656 domain-containing protein, partial [Polyangiaceae bacterium]